MAKQNLTCYYVYIILVGLYLSYGLINGRKTLSFFFVQNPLGCNSYIDVGNVKFFLWQNIDYRILYTTTFYYRLDAQEQVLLIISKFKRPGIYNIKHKPSCFFFQMHLDVQQWPLKFEVTFQLVKCFIIANLISLQTLV